MKNLLTLGLLSVFLFNIIGYRILFSYLEQVEDHRLEAKLENFSDTDKRLVTFKIPINLPYQTSWKGFERTDGEIVLKGITYRYVKRKIQNDTLILLCLNYNAKTRLEKNNDDYFKKVNSLNAQTGKKPPMKLSKTNYHEFCKKLLNEPGIAETNSSCLYFLNSCLTSGHLPFIEYPPENYSNALI